jgi:hypothetical protein
MRNLPKIVSAVLLTVAVAACSFAQDTVTISSKKKADSTSSLKAELNLDIAGMTGVLKMVIRSKVSKVDDSKAEVVSKFEDLSVEVGGSDPGISAQELVREYDAKGVLTKATGGIEGGDTYRISVVMEFFAVSTAYEVGKEVTLDVPENKVAECKGLKVTQVYQGKAKVGDREGFKFVQKVKEAGDTGLTTDVTFVVQEDGTILSIDGKFTNMPVPAAGSAATGSFKAEIKA